MKVAVVTGAAAGIGAAVAARLQRDGYTVVGVDRQPPHSDTRVETVIGDLQDAAVCSNLIEAVIERHGRLDALVNNAAIALYKPITETTAADWDETFAVNVRAAFLLTKAAISGLSQSRGSITNISSVHAVATSRSVAAYAASKAALVGLTRAAALELGSAGIRVNAVLPGATDTDMLRHGLSRGHVDTGQTIVGRIAELGGRHPLGRIGLPDEIAAMVAFLASDECSFVTGGTFVVDGGALAALSTE